MTLAELATLATFRLELPLATGEGQFQPEGGKKSLGKGQNSMKAVSLLPAMIA